MVVVVVVMLPVLVVICSVWGSVRREKMKAGAETKEVETRRVK